MFRLTDEDVTIPSSSDKINMNDEPKIENNLKDDFNPTVHIKSEDDCIITEIHRVLKLGGAFIDTLGDFSTQFILTPLSLLITRHGYFNDKDFLLLLFNTLFCYNLTWKKFQKINCVLILQTQNSVTN